MPAHHADLQRPITLRAADGAPIPLRRTEFSVVVDGPFVTTSATAVFHHGGEATIEADLVIPLPPFASVRALQARWGQRCLDGAVRGRDEAKRTYEAAVAQGHAAALGEGEGEDFARIRVAPIEAGADVVISLTLLHGAVPTAEGHRVVVPLTYMPRYVEGAAELSETEAAALARSRPTHSDARADARFTIRGLSADRVRCVTHRTRASAEGEDLVIEVEDAPLDRDLVLELLDRAEGETTISLRGSGSEGADGMGPCTLATVTPERFADEGPTTPRTVLFLVDRSGSMGGGPMESAKRAVRGSLRALNAQDRFNIIAFDDRLDALAQRVVPFSDKALAEADRFTDALEARGGTEASAALRAVLSDTLTGATIAWKAKPEDDTRKALRVVVFMTDGDVANAAKVLREAREALNATRIHVLGIGDSVDHALLGELAALGGGTYTPVSTDEDLERAIQRLKSAIEAPVWTSVEAVILRRGEEVELTALEPARRWDLFAGSPFTFAWRGAAEEGDALRLRGLSHDGVVRERTISLAAAREIDDAHARWASMRARRLTYRFSSDDDRLLKLLGINFSLVTRRTSLVGVDASAPGGRVEAVLAVSYPLPRNTSHELTRAGVASYGAAAVGMAAPGAMPMAKRAAAPRAAPAKSRRGIVARAMDLFSAPGDSDDVMAEMDGEAGDRAMYARSPAPLPPAPAAPAYAPAPAPAPSAADDPSALRALLLDQRADGLFGDIATSLAAVAALVSRGHTHREGDFRAELKRTLATLRARVASLSNEEALWATMAIALLTAPHGDAPTGLSAELVERARAISLTDPNALRRSVIAFIEGAPDGWDRAASASLIRQRFLR